MTSTINLVPRPTVPRAFTGRIPIDTSPPRARPGAVAADNPRAQRPTPRTPRSPTPGRLLSEGAAPADAERKPNTDGNITEPPELATDLW